MNKVLFVLGCLCLLVLSSFVVAYGNQWSNPTYKDGSPIEWKEPTTKPETRPCSNEEWNGYFEDYRGGLVSQEDTIKKLRGCDRW